MFEYLLVGALITNTAQIQEVKGFSNSVSFAPQSLEELTEYLDAIDNDLIPVIIVDAYFFDTTLMKYVDADKSALYAAIEASSYAGPITLCFDEPFWRVRNVNGSSSGHLDTKHTIESIIQSFDGRYDFLYIEAFAEIYQQRNETGGMLLPVGFDQVGLNCYGPVSACGGYGGVGKHHQLIYYGYLLDAMHKVGYDAKIFLTAGALLGGSNMFQDEGQVINQFYDYLDLAEYLGDKLGGFGVFTWGDYDSLTGARNMPAVRAFVEHELRKIR